jgi:hypothetical protein
MAGDAPAYEVPVCPAIPTLPNQYFYSHCAA